MKTWLSIEPGGPECLKLSDVAPPSLERGQVLISVRACGLNFPDLLFMRDHYQVKLPRPFAPGAEIAGTIVAVADDVTGFALGDPVVAVTGHGGLAEMAAVSADRCFPLASGVGFADAASLLFTYGTVHYALRRRAHLQPGERVLVLGAGGGIGLAAVEVAVAMGAEVCAAASSEDKLTLARARGAHKCLLYPSELSAEGSRPLAAAFKSLVGDSSADIVIDPVGGLYSEAALRAIAWEGRYLVIGFAAGIPQLPLNLALLKGCQIIGVDWRQFQLRDPSGFATDTCELIAMVGRGQIRPNPREVVPFSAAPEALSRMDQREINGKIVVELS